MAKGKGRGREAITYQTVKLMEDAELAGVAGAVGQGEGCDVMEIQVGFGDADVVL